MNTDQAYKTLGLSNSASKEEVKKAFKKLAAKFHPDINKDADAEQKFKEVNQAFKTITEPPPQQTIPFDPFSNPFGGNVGWRTSSVRSSKTIVHPPLQLNIELTFSESILGCKKNIKTNKYIECESCNGKGGELTNQSCTYCNGQGQKTTQNRMAIFIEECSNCNGTGKKFEDCKVCSGNGAQQSERSFDVSIPGGIESNQIIRLGGAGHFYNIHDIKGYHDAFIKVNVTQDPKMKLSGRDVISDLEVSLLDALDGATKTIETVHGSKTITIPKKTKHKDLVEIKDAGAVTPKGTGSHIVELQIVYPDNLDEVVNVLKKE